MRITRLKLLLELLLAAALLSAPPARATEATPLYLAQADDWQALSEAERSALSSHSGQWQSYAPHQRQRLRAGVQRYQTLSPDERRDALRGHERYRNLPPQEREQLRERYQKSQRGGRN